MVGGVLEKGPGEVKLNAPPPPTHGTSWLDFGQPRGGEMRVGHESGVSKRREGGLKL